MVEVVLAALGGIALAVLLTWPTAAHLGAASVPGDIGDPLLDAWQVAWGGHALLHQPGAVFDSNTFWPLSNSWAFSDTLLGYAPAGFFGSGPHAAVVRYDVLFLGSYALAFFGAYLLARQLDTSRWAAAVAGAGFAAAPWRLAQVGHLQILSTGGIPLALALLLRGHAGLLGRGRDRPAVALAGWAVAVWQVSLGFGLGLAFSYVLGGIVVVGLLAWLVMWLRRHPPVIGRGLLAADGLGLVGFVGIGLALAAPYLAVVHTHPEARRQVADITLFSPPWQGLFLTPAGNAVWGSVQAGGRSSLGWPPEMTLAPGATLLTLAVLGVVAGRWRLRTRLALAAAAVLVAVLSLGTTVAGGRYTYLVLFDHLPGWQGVRTSGRLIVWVTLILALLAATGVDRLRGWLDRRRVFSGAALSGLVCLALLAAVVAEGRGEVVQAPVPAAPVALSTLAAPIYVLTDGPVEDTQVMLWSTDGFPAVANGNSGFEPTELARLRAVARGFPSAASLAYFADRGIRTLVVPRADPALVATLRAEGYPARVSGAAIVVPLRRLPPP